MSLVNKKPAQIFEITFKPSSGKCSVMYTADTVEEGTNYLLDGGCLVVIHKEGLTDKAEVYRLKDIESFSAQPFEEPMEFQDL